MAKIARALQKIFGSSAGSNQRAVFGSLAAGSVAYSTDPATIQSLANYLTGWYGAVIGGNSPAIQDMNSLCFLYAYQLAYLFQAGVAEWNTDTVYYIGSLVNDGSGNLYRSLTDNNTGNALSSLANWALQQNGGYNKLVGGSAIPLLSGAGIAAGDSILVISDIAQSTQILVSVDDVRIDFMPGKRLLSTVTGASPFAVTGARFRSNNLSVRANGALTSGFSLLDMSGNDGIINAGYLEANNAGIALTNAVTMGGARNWVNASIIATLGTYTNPYTDGGTNNNPQLRG